MHDIKINIEDSIGTPTRLENQEILMTADDRLCSRPLSMGDGLMPMPLVRPTQAASWTLIRIITNRYTSELIIGDLPGCIIRCSMEVYRRLKKEWMELFMESMKSYVPRLPSTPPALFSLCSTRRYDFIAGSWENRPMIEVKDSPIAGQMAVASHKYHTAEFEDMQIIGAPSPMTGTTCITLRVKRCADYVPCPQSTENLATGVEGSLGPRLPELG